MYTCTYHLLFKEYVSTEFRMLFKQIKFRICTNIKLDTISLYMYITCIEITAPFLLIVNISIHTSFARYNARRPASILQQKHVKNPKTKAQSAFSFRSGCNIQATSEFWKSDTAVPWSKENMLIDILQMQPINSVCCKVQYSRLHVILLI